MNAHASILTVGILLSASLARADPRVTIESDNAEVSLHQVISEVTASAYGSGGSAHSSAMASHMVCRAPCNTTTSSQYRYFIDGDGMPMSRKFLLPMDGDVTVKVNTGHNILFGTGIAFICLGGIAATTGAITGPITGNEELLKLTIGIGVPVALTGIVMLLKGRTTVEVFRGTGVALDLRRGAVTF